MLPSVILSLNEQYVQFLIELADFGCKINNTQVKECTRGILDLLPIAKHTAERIKAVCRESHPEAKQQGSSSSNNSPPRQISAPTKLESLYSLKCTQTQCWYYLKVTHALLMPAVYLYNFEEIKQFQVSHNVAYH
jgi:hypothetical protein